MRDQRARERSTTPTTGSRPTCASGAGRRATPSRWPTAPRAPSLFYADWVERDRRRTAPAARPIARGCWPIRGRARRRRSPALSPPISRSARPTATRRRPATSAAADRPRSLRPAAPRGAVAAVLVRMVAAHQARIALAQRVAVGVLAEAEHRQRAPLGLAEARRLCAARGLRPNRPEIASSGSAKSLHAGRRVGAVGGERRLGRSQPASGAAPRVISSALMPSKKLYFALCSRTWSRHRKRQLPGPSKLAGCSGALNSPGAAQPGTAHLALAPSTRPCIWIASSPSNASI